QLPPPDPSKYPDSLPILGDVTPPRDILHDPSQIILARDNKTWLLYTTGTGIRMRASTDKVTWHNIGYVFGSGKWNETTQPEQTFAFLSRKSPILWAPDVTYYNGFYWLVYSASQTGINKSGIFLAKSITGLPGNWTDEGMIISSDKSDNFNAIDPSRVMDEKGQWWLTFGSYWTGEHLILNSDKFVFHRAGGASLEASFIFKWEKYWFLFTSFGSCCSGKDSTYSVRVARSKTLGGPYVDANGVKSLDGGGTEILSSHRTATRPYWGTGGQSVFLDEKGQPFLVYHYSGVGISDYHIGLNNLTFRTGWPVVI
ncbi:Arabinanase/levansucrase/invertase, partial [Meredithblackwellia eburnea MCA 4105]